jgi:hypothetical protein
MDYDKVKADGTVIQAPRFTYRVLDSVPVVFQLAEWLLVIVAFQYVDARFGYIAARTAWWLLSLSFALYVGVLASNVLWRSVEDPYEKGAWDIFSRFLFPLLSGVLVFGMQYLVKQMVLAQQAGAQQFLQAEAAPRLGLTRALKSTIRNTTVAHLTAPNPGWVDWLSAMLVPTIALFGVFIAWQQWRTNRARLKSELFDRRYAQFKVVTDFIGSIMASGKCLGEEQRKYLVGTRGMRFAFDKRIAEYVDKHIWAPAIDLECLDSELEGLPVGPERAENVRRQRDIKVQLHDELEVLEERFAKYLQLRH